MAISSWNNVFNSVSARLWDTLFINWHLGFTAFGGPPVHFKILHDKFVVKLQWIDEQMVRDGFKLSLLGATTWSSYTPFGGESVVLRGEKWEKFQELFSITQSFSGPASTKMVYCINLLHDGALAAIVSFLIWSLPGALGMYGLAIGVSNIDEALPGPASALLSGLNAATVGIIALAAVQLSGKAITDKLTRAAVFASGAAGLLYNALWYFPVIMIVCGAATLTLDSRVLHKPLSLLSNAVAAAKAMLPRKTIARQQHDITPTELHLTETGNGPIPESRGRTSLGALQRPERGFLPVSELHREGNSPTSEEGPRVIPPSLALDTSWRVGVSIIGGFLAAFITVMVVRGVLISPPLLFRLFANMFLAGSIIFGGGPVVVPLLREYVVAEGWVTQRDFIIGLAIIQAFPGPNFNFAVFLGALTAINGGYSPIIGALIGWIGLFTPGLTIGHGMMGVWSVLRSRPSVKSVLRGINAGAVGLIFTAVYRVWQTGYIDDQFQSGRSLGDDPWWVVVAATSYVGGRWFGVSPPLGIACGAALGLVRYGVVSA